MQFENELTAVKLYMQSLLNGLIPSGTIDTFLEDFASRLILRYEGHWDESNPNKGSGYRCIQHSRSRSDPLLAKCMDFCFSDDETKAVMKALPDEFNLFIDPREVCIRIGNNSIQTLYKGENPSLSPKAKSFSPASIRKQLQESNSAPPHTPRLFTARYNHGNNNNARSPQQSRRILKYSPMRNSVRKAHETNQYSWQPMRFSPLTAAAPRMWSPRSHLIAAQ